MNASLADNLKPEFSRTGQVVIAAIILVVLYLISLQNYLLFHSIVELAGIAVAYAIFIIIWNTRKTISNTFFLIVGISFLFIGTIDLFHTLAYKGMGVFPWATADLPTQLWIAARYFQSITFLIATLFIGRSITRDRKYDTGIIFAACAAACGLLLASIFAWHNFPSCFIEGSGLTPFKIFSEYVISLILIAAGIVLYHKRHFFARDVWQFLIAALIFLTLGELAFTSYISVYGFMNMLGHLFRLVSVYLFYRAFVVVGLTRPFDLLFREIRQKNQVLQSSEERFHTMADWTYDWEYWIDQNRRMVYLSPSVERITGYPAEEFNKDPLLVDRIVHMDDRPLWDSHITIHQTGLKQDDPSGIEFRIIHRDGSTRWIAHVCRSIWDDKSVFAGTRVSNRDITKQKQAEEQLKFTNTVLSTQMESSPDAILVVDEAGKMILYNQQFVTMWDVPPDVVASRSDERALQSVLDKLVDPEAFLNGVKYLYAHPEEKIHDEIALRDGRVLERYSTPMTGSDRTYYGRLWTFRDITGRKNAERELHTLAADLRSIIDNAPAMIWYKDTENNFIRVNPTGARAFGLPVKEIEGKSAYDLFPDMAEQYYQDDLEVISSGKPKTGIIEQMETATGEMLWVMTDKIPLKDQNGTVTGVLVFVIDITARKKTEDALAQASKKLNLLSSITRHDILNQLMVLLGNLEMTLEDIENPEDREFIDHSMQAAKTIQRQIEFTREYQELGVKAPVWVNVDECIRQAIASLPVGDVTITVDRSDLEVYADQLFMKVFYNLLDNALRYGGDKMTSISVTSHEEDDSLVILFEDNGSGISEEDKKKLFMKGFGKNTGLGLFLSREILSITGITITENSMPGKGARFKIIVPKGMYRFNPSNGEN